MSYKVSGTTITLTRGDTFMAQVSITDSNGDPYVPSEGDSVRFAMKAKIIPGNIKKGISVLGVEGDCEPSSDVTAQSKTATPSTVKQTILPDDGVDYLSQVVINPIAYVESANSAGGTTVTIAGRLDGCKQGHLRNQGFNRPHKRYGCSRYLVQGLHCTHGRWYNNHWNIVQQLSR